jgi:preprotein translocase subunit SecG
MTTILLVIHLFLAIALVISVLLQRAEGGALGIGGGGGGGMMTGRAQANLLTRVTAVLAALFMMTSITLAVIASHARQPTSVLDRGVLPSLPTTQGAPATPAPTAPAQPGAPLGR